MDERLKRFLLGCHSLLSTESVTAKPVFERAFREDGLLIAIGTDNGVPFATQAKPPLEPHRRPRSSG